MCTNYLTNIYCRTREAKHKFSAFLGVILLFGIAVVQVKVGKGFTVNAK